MPTAVIVSIIILFCPNDLLDEISFYPGLCSRKAVFALPYPLSPSGEGEKKFLFAGYYPDMRNFV